MKTRRIRHGLPLLGAVHLCLAQEQRHWESTQEAVECPVRLVIRFTLYTRGDPPLASGLLGMFGSVLGASQHG